jgi:predicted aconitase with swiveling domain
MARLGLGYDAVRAINPKLIYCSLSGYGQTGSRAQLAGHDINYLADCGLLALVSGRDGAPALPAVPLADIAGGSYPLVINILLALLKRGRTGEGCHLDIAMADNVMCLGYWALARGLRDGAWPQPDGDMITGSRARYRNYPARDSRFIAVGALEEKFWRTFCDIIELPEDLRDDHRTPEQSIRGVAQRLAAHDAAHWEAAFAGHDICCSVVKTMEEAVRSPATAERGLLRYEATAAGQRMPALPIPLADAVRADAPSGAVPPLGEGNGTLIAEPESTQSFVGIGICGTSASGPALVSSADLALSLIDPDTGIIVQPGHPLQGVSISGRVLVFPKGGGSSSGSYRLLDLAERGNAPIAIVNDQANAVVTAGAVLAGIPLVHRLSRPVSEIRDDAFVLVDAINGLVVVHGQPPCN